MYKLNNVIWRHSNVNECSSATQMIMAMAPFSSTNTLDIYTSIQMYIEIYSQLLIIFAMKNFLENGVIPKKSEQKTRFGVQQKKVSSHGAYLSPTHHQLLCTYNEKGNTSINITSTANLKQCSSLCVLPSIKYYVLYSVYVCVYVMLEINAPYDIKHPSKSIFHSEKCTFHFDLLHMYFNQLTRLCYTRTQTKKRGNLIIHRIIVPFCSLSSC